MQKKYVILFLLGFVLLIAIWAGFFILTTRMSSPKAFKLTVPDDSKSESVILNEEQEDSTSVKLNLLLLRNGNIICYKARYNETQLTLKQLHERLMAEKAASENLVVLIRPEEEAGYKLVVDVLDEMQICDIKKYSVIDLSEKDKEFARYVYSKD